MPAGAHSTASDLPRWTTAALEALYDAAHWGTLTMDPDIEAMKTALPEVPASRRPSPPPWGGGAGGGAGPGPGAPRVMTAVRPLRVLVMVSPCSSVVRGRPVGRVSGAPGPTRSVSPR